MINYLTAPFRWFFKLEAAGGLVLLVAAVIALILSNTKLSDLYFGILNYHILVGAGKFALDLSILHWINDALMAVFFFVVTLEIKREFVHGELSKPKQAALPIIANATKKTLSDIGTLEPSSDRTPMEKAISVAEGIAQPFKVSPVSKLMIT